MILPNNVYVNDISIGQQSIVEAQKLIDETVEGILNKKITISFSKEGKEQKHEFTFEKLGYASNKDKLKTEIEGIINNDLKLINKYKNYKSIEQNGKKLNLEFDIDHDMFITALEKFDDSILKNPIDAKYTYEKDSIIIVDGELGEAFDKDSLYNELKEGVNNFESRTLTLNLKPVTPKITREILEKKGKMEKIATFKTTFNPNNINRASNVRLAAKLIDGTILAPGEIFSFNETVGKRTVDRGFKEAGVYIRGQVDKDIGGGICQVSTTLYNAALLSNLSIVERSNHTLTVPYVPLSRDASVNWGTKDLKIENDTDNYVYIHSKASKNTVLFDLFGSKTNKDIKLKSVMISKAEPPIEFVEDETKPEGEEIVEDKGHIGYKSKLIKYVYEDGKLIDSKVVNVDRYRTTPQIIKVGTKPINNPIEGIEEKKAIENIEAIEGSEGPVTIIE